MADSFSVLAQLDAPATALTDLYTVPGATQVLGWVVVANRGAAGTTYRVSIAVAGIADNPKQYLAYDLPIIANDTAPRIPVVLGPGDKVRVYAGAVSLSFTLLGLSIT